MRRLIAIFALALAGSLGGCQLFIHLDDVQWDGGGDIGHADVGTKPDDAATISDSGPADAEEPGDDVGPGLDASKKADASHRDGSQAGQDVGEADAGEPDSGLLQTPDVGVSPESDVGVLDVGTPDVGHPDTGPLGGACETVTMPGGSRNWMGVWGFGNEDVWAVSEDGAIAHLDKTGWSENQVVSGADGGVVSLSRVWGASSNDVWATGKVMLHKQGVGQTWAESSISSAQVMAIWGAGTDEVWAADWFGGTSGYLYRWITSNWTTIYSFVPAGAFKSIHGRSAGDIWAVGYGMETAHWDGIAWTEKIKSNSSYPQLTGVWCGTSDVWAVGGDGQVKHWNGSDWDTAFAMVGWGNGIYGASDADIWAVGQSSAAHYDGTAWSDVTLCGPLAGKQLIAVWSSGTEAWLVGDGVVLHWTKN